MKVRGGIFLFFILLANLSLVSAQEEKRISFNGFGGISLLPGSAKINPAGQMTNIFGGYSPGITGGLGVNYRFNERFSLSNNAFIFFASKTNFNFKVAGLKSSLRYYPWSDVRKFSPFVSAGLNLNLLFLNRKAYTDSIFPDNSSSVIGPGVTVTKITYNYENLKLSFVPSPGANIGAGCAFRLSDKISLYTEYAFVYSLAKPFSLIKDNYQANKANLSFHFATAGVTFKLLKPKKQLLAILTRDQWDGDPTVSLKGEIVYKNPKKAPEKVVPVEMRTNEEDTILTIIPTDKAGLFEYKNLRADDYHFMLSKRNRKILRADIQLIHDNRKVDIFDDFPELQMIDDFEANNLISRDNNFSVILREGFQHEVDATILSNSIFGKVTPIGNDSVCRNMLVLLKTMNDSVLAVTEPKNDCSFNFNNVEPGAHKIVFVRKDVQGDMKFSYEFTEAPPVILRQFNTEEDSINYDPYLEDKLAYVDTIDINDILLSQKYEKQTDLAVNLNTKGKNNDPTGIMGMPSNNIVTSKNNSRVASLKDLKPGYTYSPDGKPVRPNGYGVQVAAFASHQNLKKFCDRLKRSRKEQVYVQVLSDEDNNYHVKLYRVIVGEYPDTETANQEMVELKNAGYDVVLRKHRDFLNPKDQ
ncbi:MAG: SPOR domain-containing protein [Cytophagaceae bacterium]|nr:SPOR domain-containing protein [Cytophagaceae bacterium]